MMKRNCEATNIFKEDLERYKNNLEVLNKIKYTLEILANDLEVLNGLFFYPISNISDSFYECKASKDIFIIYRKLPPHKIQFIRVGEIKDFECRMDDYTVGFSVSCASIPHWEKCQFYRNEKFLPEELSMKAHHKPTLSFSLTALITVVGIISCGMMFFDLKLHILMLACWLVVAFFARCLGYTYAELEVGAYELIQRAMGAVIILMCVGALIGAWISAGTVPIMIYAGLKIITPKLFLVTSFIRCSITSLTTGTSWGTIGTVGLALMGIGAGLGFDPGLTAATIICGAYFGDKMSPLSDTTNMAAAVSGVPLLRHVRHMANTIAPAFIISIILYGIMGFKYSGGSVDSSQLNSILAGISENFPVDFVPALPMLLVLFLLIRQTNPVVAIVGGALFGVFIAVFYVGMDLKTAFNSMWDGYKGEFSDPILMKLLNRGGVISMLNIAALVIFACGLGGMLRHIGVVDAILSPIAKKAKSGLSLVLSTLIIGYGSLMLTASCYFSIVLNGTLMAPLFRKQGFRPENCSRIVEDAGTLGGPLVPWSSNALFPIGMLSISYIEYLPYSFLLYLTPLISISYAMVKFNMPKLTPQEMKEYEESGKND